MGGYGRTGGERSPNGKETARHIAAFEAWYHNSRGFSATVQQGIAAERSLHIWCDRFHWHARADARDAEARRIADEDAIQRRAEMLKRHRQAGELLTRRGMEFHAKRPIEKAADATAAIKSGIEIERTAEGLPTWVAGILNADEEELLVLERTLLGSVVEEGEPALEDEGGPNLQPSTFNLQTGPEAR